MIRHQWHLLLTWFNSNLSMDKSLQSLWTVGWNYFSILGLQLDHVSKGPRSYSMGESHEHLILFSKRCYFVMYDIRYVDKMVALVSYQENGVGRATGHHYGLHKTYPEWGLWYLRLAVTYIYILEVIKFYKSAIGIRVIWEIDSR